MADRTDKVERLGGAIDDLERRIKDLRNTEDHYALRLATTRTDIFVLEAKMRGLRDALAELTANPNVLTKTKVDREIALANDRSLG